jgi:large subunit ribosomal protein L25
MSESTETTEYGALEASIRNNRGKGAARSLRREGLVPGVIYGQGKENLALSLHPSALRKATDPARSWNTFYTLTIKEPGKPDRVESAVLVDIQNDAVRNAILHVDFMRVDPEQEVVRNVPLRLHGRAIGVFKGGKLKTFRRVLQVAAKPADIPVEIAVDITPVDGGQSLRMKDITLNAARLVEDPEQRILTVEVPKAKAAEEEETPKGKAKGKG